MTNKTLKTVLGTVVTLGVLAATGQQAQAGSMHNGWNYSMDSFRDGTDYTQVGQNSAYEMYGMAFKETDDSFVFAFNSNLAFDVDDSTKNGDADNGALQKRISYGDLFLNFANPGGFNGAEGSLYAVRFDASNDTDMELGLYENVTSGSVTTKNMGYSTMQGHTNRVNNQLNGKASYGDLKADTTYFDSTKAASTTISSGKRLGSVSLLNVASLSNLGLNFGTPGLKPTDASVTNPAGQLGKYTFGFQISKSLFGRNLPTGDFVASLFAECGNDGMVLTGNVADVPEPASLVGLAAIGLMAGGGQLLRRRSQTSAAEA